MIAESAPAPIATSGQRSRGRRRSLLAPRAQMLAPANAPSRRVQKPPERSPVSSPSASVVLHGIRLIKESPAAAAAVSFSSNCNPRKADHPRPSIVKNCSVEELAGSVFAVDASGSREGFLGPAAWDAPDRKSGVEGKR